MLEYYHFQHCYEFYAQRFIVTKSDFDMHASTRYLNSSGMGTRSTGGLVLQLVKLGIVR